MATHTWLTASMPNVPEPRAGAWGLSSKVLSCIALAKGARRQSRCNSELCHNTGQTGPRRYGVLPLVPGWPLLLPPRECQFSCSDPAPAAARSPHPDRPLESGPDRAHGGALPDVPEHPGPEVRGAAQVGAVDHDDQLTPLIPLRPASHNPMLPARMPDTARGEVSGGGAARRRRCRRRRGSPRRWPAP